MRRGLNILPKIAAMFLTAVPMPVPVLAAVLVAVAVVGCREDPGVGSPGGEDPSGKSFEVAFRHFSVEFAVGQTKDIDFDVTGEGAVNPKMPKIAVPEGWDFHISRFERDAEGFVGAINVTAPGEESSGTLEVSVLNGEGVERKASAMVSASAVPPPPPPPGITVDIDAPDILPRFELSERRSVSFSVGCDLPATLTAEVAATNSWSVRLEKFSPAEDSGSNGVFAGEAPCNENLAEAADSRMRYSGSVLIGAPDAESSSEITIYVKDGNGEVLGSASFGVECAKGDEPQPDVVVEIEDKKMNFGYSQTRATSFTVKGSDAKDLTATAEGPDHWAAEATLREEPSGGYSGTLTITSPNGYSDGRVVLRISDGGRIALSESIEVSCSYSGLVFGEEEYIFGIEELKTIDYTVFVTDGNTMKGAEVVCPGGWSVDHRESPPYFRWNAEQGVYEGGFRLRSGIYPEKTAVSVRLTDWNGEKTDWPVEVICEGSSPPPPPPDPERGANCIVVSEAGPVSFAARKGNGDAVVGSEARWIWADSEGLIDEASLAYSAGEITFETSPSLKNGNMLIALLDASGGIVWSWHVWFVRGLNLDAAPGKFMNMALGASSSVRPAHYGTDDTGLLYQWGRKEPFPGRKDKLGLDETPSTAFQSNTKATILADGYSWGATAEKLDTHDEAARHPTEMAVMVKNMPSAGPEPWSAESDPCPEGWRVPTREELLEYWASTGRANTWFESDGIAPDRYYGAWWSTTGARVVDTGQWQGALISNASLMYWSSTSAPLYSQGAAGYSPEDEGYLYAASLTNYRSSMRSADRRKSEAVSVRCVKE